MVDAVFEIRKRETGETIDFYVANGFHKGILRYLSFPKTHNN